MKYPEAYGFSLDRFNFDDFVSWVADYESQATANAIAKKHDAASIIKTIKDDPHRNPQWLLRKYLFMKHNVLDANRLL